jgi:LuxR family maltose regulon positive regulatory protein
MLYELNDLDSAARYLMHGIGVGQEWNTSDMLVYGYTVLAQVRQAQGDERGATQMIQKAEQYVHRYQQRPWIVAIMVGQQVRLAIAQGRSGVQHDEAGERKNAYVGDFDRVTLIRLHLAKGETDQALRLVERLLPAAQTQGRGGSVTELQMLAALVYAQRGEIEVAMERLAVALARAAPEGYVRLFADEGAPMAVLLAEYVGRERRASGRAGPAESLGYARALLAAIGHPDAAEQREGPLREVFAHPLGEAEGLSARELQILRGLAEGKSNTALAQDLTLEVSTVKWHLSRIYAKLNVSSRTQAIRQARELAMV